jgi:hypothetical protein
VSIGTLNEGPLHQAVKALYLEDGATEEVTVGDFIADVKAQDQTLVEIQTAGFGSMKRKLATLVEDHRVVLVHPIAAVRYIVKLPTETDQLATRRRSPKRGAVSHVLDELVSIPKLLCHPNFELEVLLIEEEELRAFDPKKVRRRGGWRVVQRRLQEVLGRERFTSPGDLFRLAPGDLPAEFTTADLAAAMGEPRWLAQKLAYCLREAEEIGICGKQGNALVYQRRELAAH